MHKANRLVAAALTSYAGLWGWAIKNNAEQVQTTPQMVYKVATAPTSYAGQRRRVVSSQRRFVSRQRPPVQRQRVFVGADAFQQARQVADGGIGVGVAGTQRGFPAGKHLEG